jgi:putative tryptophan/tyrosine transport system substrate-binding protein
MRRREFIRLFSSAVVVWPLTARAQQSALPVIGYLDSRAPGDAPQRLAAALQGLKDTGFVDGMNVAIEYRFAENRDERMPALAEDLVQRRVAVIAAAGIPALVAAKTATTTIPIVFEMGADPVRLGIIAKLNRPGGNVTGVTSISLEVAPKRLELLHQFLPAASVMALLVDPSVAALAETQSRSVKSAAHSLGLELHILNASTESDFDAVFASLNQLRTAGLVIGGGPFLVTQQERLAELATRHAVPAVGEYREFVAAGGLASYGSSLIDSYRLFGVYAARILKGEKPGDLPVQQSTKVELYINLKTAKALSITVPIPVLGRADEVIE